MGLLSNTGLLPTCPKTNIEKQIDEAPPPPDLKRAVVITQAPFILRPYAGLYNPFATRCSVLCNHPTDIEAKDFLRRAKDAWEQVEKGANLDDPQDLDRSKMPHDIVTEEMFRRYTETDSRPLTPAPTLASGKSRGSRRCLTPDQPHTRTAIVLDLRRSHSQETLYYHGYSTSEMTVGNTTSATNDRSTLPSVSLSDAHSRLVKGDCEQLPPLASPLVLLKRTERPPKEPSSVKAKKHLRWLESKLNFCPGDPLASIPEHPNVSASPRIFTEPFHSVPPIKYPRSILKTDSTSQLKALNLNKGNKGKNKGSGDTPASQRSKADKNEKETGDENELDINDDAGSIERRRGKRRRKGRQSDRLTSAGLAAQTQQDPETQIAGIGTDSHNPSSRGSIAPVSDRDLDDCLPPVVKPEPPRFTDSFLDRDILKYLHREVDEDAIESEFDTKRRYVLEEAFRTRPERSVSQEVHNLMKEIKVPAVSLGDWLHIPRVFSRQKAQFSLPLDTRELEGLTPMQYAARYVNIKKCKQLLYLTVLRKFRPEGYRMPIKDIEEGLILMMGVTMTVDQVKQFKSIMEWDSYQDDENPADIRITMQKSGIKKLSSFSGDSPDDKESIKYRSWCGMCAICERMYGRFPPRNKDPPDGMELGDFTMVETKLATFKVHSGLAEILHVIRTR